MYRTALVDPTYMQGYNITLYNTRNYRLRTCITLRKFSNTVIVSEPPRRTEIEKTIDVSCPTDTI